MPIIYDNNKNNTKLKNTKRNNPLFFFCFVETRAFWASMFRISRRSKTCVAFAFSYTSNQSMHFDNIDSASERPFGGFKSNTESSTSSSTYFSTAVTLKIIWSSLKISNPPFCLTNPLVFSFIEYFGYYKLFYIIFNINLMIFNTTK